MDRDMRETQKTLLQELIELRELAFVTILRSYLQLNFDGPYLNIYTLPDIGEAGVSIKPGELGYYDRLCKLVGKRLPRLKSFPASV
jgi:hypothetical protein